jgi:hypothetical protein
MEKIQIIDVGGSVTMRIQEKIILGKEGNES